MIERILVPVDGSERSKEAFTFATETFTDTSFTAYHVIQGGSGDLGAFAGMTGELPDEDAGLEASEKLLEEMRTIGSDRGVRVETNRGRGRPDRLIINEAAEGDYDLVVLGSHGRDGIARVLLGSVAEKVVRRSPVPVLVYRPGTESS